MAASGGGRYRYSLSQIIRLHLLLGIHLVFIPKGEPGRNATVESFNNTWQIRVLRHRCPALRAVRRCSDRFLEYYHVRKPSRSLTVAAHGTRFPGVIRPFLLPKAWSLGFARSMPTVVSSSTAPNTSSSGNLKDNTSWRRSPRITGRSTSSMMGN